MSCFPMSPRLCLSLLLLSSTIIQIGCISNSHLIYNKLFVGSGYQKNVLPVEDSSKTLEIELEFELIKIRSVDEVNQMMTFVGFVVAQWEDEHLTWNVSDYGGVSSIVAPASLIWLPDFAIVNSAGSFYNPVFRDEFRVLITNTGKVTWDFGGIFEVSCELILTYFPFDKQVCFMSVENWMYQKSQVTLKNATSAIRSDDFTLNGMWSVITTKTYSSDVYFDSFPGVPFPRVKFDIFLERKSAYFVFNIILPCAALGLLALLGMWLPADSGEKVGLGITIILSFSVYQLIVANSTPRSSENTPILSIWMMIMMATSTIDTVVSILVLYMHHYKALPLPNWLRTLAFKVLAYALCMKDIVPKSAYPDDIIKININASQHESESISMKVEVIDCPEEETSGVSNKLDHILRHLALISNDLKDTQEEGARMEEWQAVSRIIDRFFFVFNLFVIAIGTAVCFSLRGSTDDLFARASK